MANPCTPWAAGNTPEKGQQFDFEIDQLHPTQNQIGMDDVTRRMESLRLKSAKQLKAYLKNPQVSVVIGPDRKFYIVDGHHKCLALLKTGLASTIRAKVIDVWKPIAKDASKSQSQKQMQKFWNTMEKNNWVYLKDSNGNRINPSELPHSLVKLKDNPYRSLAGYLREEGVFGKGKLSFFVEFAWAQALKKHFDKETIDPKDPQVRLEAIKFGTENEASKGLPGRLKHPTPDIVQLCKDVGQLSETD